MASSKTYLIYSLTVTAILVLIESIILQFSNEEPSFPAFEAGSMDGIPACLKKGPVNNSLFEATPSYCGRNFYSLESEFGNCPLMNGQSECPLKPKVTNLTRVHLNNNLQYLQILNDPAAM